VEKQAVQPAPAADAPGLGTAPAVS
jgi:hypothetical protein